MMTTTRMTEAWLNLMTEAMRGTSEAQEAIKLLSEMSNTSVELTRWMTRFLPTDIDTSKPEAFGDWLEEWYKMMGIVPRHRYLELLNRYEQLKTRMEESEEKIRRLRPMVGVRGHEEEAQKVLDLWETLLQETLKTQAEWMRTWAAGIDKDKDKSSTT